MNIARRIAISRQLIAQIEDQAEAVSFEARICVKVKDEKGLEATKKNLLQLENRLAAAAEIVAEIEKEAADGAENKAA